MLRKLHYSSYYTSIRSVCKRTILLFALITLISCSKSFAANGYANNANGNWNNPSTWLFNGTPRTPMCGDTVTIPAAYTVTVNSQENYTGCVIPMIIIVSGTLEFTGVNNSS